MSAARRVLNWLGLLLLIAIVIPFVIFAVPGIVGAEGSYVVLSGSMEPTISTGDAIIVDGVDPAEIEERDVITYLRSGADTPTTHRVVGITEEGGELAFVTQGDANDQPDASPVRASQVMGIVVFTIPFIGYVIEFVNTPTGFVTLVILPFALLLLSEIHSIVWGDNADSHDGESDESPGDAGHPGRVQTSSVPTVGTFKTNGPRVRGPDDTGGDPTLQKPARSPTAADTNGREADPETVTDEDDSDEAIALTRTDLRLSLGVLAGTAVYAAWIVYNIQTAWSFAVAFASVIGLLLVGSMYYAAGEEDEAEATPDGDQGPQGSQQSSGGVSGAAPEVRTDGASVPPRAEGNDE